MDGCDCELQLAPSRLHPLVTSISGKNLSLILIIICKVHHYHHHHYHHHHHHHHHFLTAFTSTVQRAAVRITCRCSTEPLQACVWPDRTSSGTWKNRASTAARKTRIKYAADFIYQSLNGCNHHELLFFVYYIYHDFSKVSWKFVHYNSSDCTGPEIASSK